MPQHGFPTLDPQTDDGTYLAQQLNQWSKAVESTHGGDMRPTYAIDGTLWVDTSAAPELVLKMVVGGVDREIARITASGQVLAGTQAVIWTENVPGHSFGPLSMARHNGTTWVKAQANNPATYAHAFVRSVNGNLVTFQSAGLASVPESYGWQAGWALWLSYDSPGWVTGVKPSAGIAQPVGVVISPTMLLINIGQPIQSEGYVKLAPSVQGDNYIRATNGNTVPLSIMRASNTVPIFGFIEWDNSRYIGGWDANGYPFGTAAPAAAQAIPVGAIMYYPGPNPPLGWLNMDGSSTAGYPILASIYGPVTPDWRARFLMSQYPPGGFTIGSAGGAWGNAIAGGNLPVLDFVNNVTLANSPGTHPMGLIYGSAEPGACKDIVLTKTRGAGAQITNIPPYVVANMITKHD